MCTVSFGKIFNYRKYIIRKQRYPVIARCKKKSRNSIVENDVVVVVVVVVVRTGKQEIPKQVVEIVK